MPALPGLRQTVTVAQVIHYVSAGNPAPVSPFLTWETAASNIQDAVNAAADWDIVLVTNGVYEYGGERAPAASMNRVMIAKPLVVRSVNGPAVTILDRQSLYVAGSKWRCSPSVPRTCAC